MSLVYVGREIHYPAFPFGSGAPGLGGRTFDEAGDGAGYIIQVPHTGNISKVHFQSVSKTTNGDLDVRLETVTSAATPLPSGTLVGTNTNGTVTINAASTRFVATLTSAAAVTLNDQIALIGYAQAGFGGSFSICNFQSSYSFSHYGSLYEVTKNGAGAWAYNSGLWGLWALEYDDGLIYPIRRLAPPQATNLDYFSSSSNPDERGNKITVPFHGRCIGAIFTIDTDSTAIDFVLYDSGGTAQRTATYTRLNGFGDCFLEWSPIEITAGTTWRLASKPQTTTGHYIQRLVFADEILKRGIGGGENAQYTHRTDAGSWTDVSGSMIKCSLIFDQISDGAGGGGGGGLKLVGSGGLVA